MRLVVTKRRGLNGIVCWWIKIGGLGMSSLYALNRSLMLKWIWRFYSQQSSLWVKVIQAIHGDDGNVSMKNNFDWVMVNGLNSGPILGLAEEFLKIYVLDFLPWRTRNKSLLKGQCRVLTDTNFDEMTYVHLLEILRRLVPHGFEQIDMYVDHFGYDIMEMVEWDRNEELRKTRNKSESDFSDDDYHYSDDDLEEIENLCSARILFRGNVEYGVNEETPQVDPDDNQIDHVYKYFKEIIEDPFMPLRKMRDDIRQKFMIDVSVGQCKRAKQLALFDHEGGLIEHYAKLYQYRQAILDSNPGSTCTLDVVESDNGSVSFKRMYICFKGVKDGWLAGCRKVIGLDGCFLKHTCRGELLTAMGRDANNQMYPIAWAVVRVENADN
ncbi:hypothetical protein Tco_1077483 [Tanacetum coccineum]